MGQKVNPISNRLGIIRGWDSNWYGGNDYGDVYKRQLYVSWMELLQLIVRLVVLNLSQKPYGVRLINTMCLVLVTLITIIYHFMCL